MPDIMVWPEIILDIALCVKSKMASIYARLSYKWKSMIFVSVIGFRGIRNIVLWLERTLSIVLWVKYMMAATYVNQKLLKFLKDCKQIRDFCINRNNCIRSTTEPIKGN